MSTLSLTLTLPYSNPSTFLIFIRTTTHLGPIIAYTFFSTRGALPPEPPVVHFPPYSTYPYPTFPFLITRLGFSVLQIGVEGLCPCTVLCSPNLIQLVPPPPLIFGAENTSVQFSFHVPIPDYTTYFTYLLRLPHKQIAIRHTIHLIIHNNIDNHY